MQLLGIIMLFIGFIIMSFGIIGIILFPDIYLRLHASSKCGTTAAGTIILGLIFYRWNMAFSIKLIIILAFLFITGPLVSHIIALSGVKNKIEFFRKERS